MGRIRVLHVDDDREFGELTAEFLEREDDGFDVVTESSATDALDRLADDQPVDCIVSDYDMPNLDGLEFLDIVREEYPRLPFILFTGMGSERVASEAIARDATDYLQKRGGTEQYELLANRVRNAVEQYRSRRHLERKKQEYQHLFEDAPVMFVIFRDEEGMPVVEDCNRRFADKLGYDIDTLRGASVRELFTEESARAAIDNDGYERALAGEFTTGERTLRTKDGDTLDVLVRGVPRTDPTGTVTGVLALYIDVTERKERQREREERRQFYETVVEESRDGIRVVQDGTVTFVDDRFAEMVGYEPAELVGEPAEKVIAEEYQETVVGRHDARMRDEETPSRYEAELLTRDGDRRHVELSVATIQQDGEPASLSLFRDVTERKERQRELERQNERLDTVLSNLPVVVYALDSEGVFTLSEGKGLAKLGLEPGEVVGESVYDVYADHEGILSDVERALDGETVTVTREVQGRDFETTVQPVFEDGEVRTVIGVAIDVTERTERERQLQRERDRLETLFDSLPNPVLYGDTVDGDPLVRRVNPAFEETFGYSQAEIEGKRGTDLVAPDEEVERARDRLQRAIEEGSVTTESERETTDGVRQFRIDTAVRNPDSDNPERYTIYTDITEQKEREQDLRRYEAIVEAMDDAVYAVDEDGRIEYVNDSYVEMKNLDRSELLGTQIGRWADGEVTKRIEDLIAEIEAGERDVGAVEYEFLTADGERIPAELRFTLLEFPDGERGRVGVIRDITERIERERELQRQNERLDEFVSVVSHDLRTPLNTLSASLDLVERTGDPDHVDRCHRALDRMEQLIDDLLTLARQGETIAEPEPVDLATVATDCWGTVETPDVEFVVDADATIMADEGRLKQLLENLFRNAVEHGDGVGEITVGSLPDGFYVADDGVGIPADERERVFESGYSTASDGTGFGLSIVETIAGAHGWDVAATESDAGGARFDVTGVEER